MSFGETQIGDIDFTGRQGALVDNSLVLDAGSVSVGQLALRPETRVALDGRQVLDSDSIFSFALRLTCERTRTTTSVEECGGGVEFGIERTTKDKQGRMHAKVRVEHVGDRESLSLNIGGVFGI